MLSKRIAGRVTSGCSHSSPILVPCLDCVEKQLVGWEQRIRHEEKMAMSDEMKRAIEDSAKAKETVERMKKEREDVDGLVNNLRVVNTNMRGLLDDAKRDVDGLRAQLKAEQSLKDEAKFYRKPQAVAK